MTGVCPGSRIDLEYYTRIMISAQRDDRFGYLPSTTASLFSRMSYGRGLSHHYLILNLGSTYKVSGSLSVVHVEYLRTP